MRSRYLLVICIAWKKYLLCIPWHRVSQNRILQLGREKYHYHSIALLCWQRLNYSRAHPVMSFIMLVFNAVPPEGSKVMRIQCCFLFLPLTCRDFSRVPEYAHMDVVGCLFCFRAAKKYSCNSVHLSLDNDLPFRGVLLDTDLNELN